MLHDLTLNFGVSFMFFLTTMVSKSTSMISESTRIIFETINAKNETISYVQTKHYSFSNGEYSKVNEFVPNE